MIFGRRRVLAIAGTVLIGGSMIGALVLSGGPSPVDVRQVQGSFGPEPMLSATFTTGVWGVGPTTTTVPPPPAPPPVETTEARTADPEPTVRPVPPRPTVRLPPWLEDLGGCDDDYETDGVCVPWLFPLLVDECDWLRSHGSRRIEVRGEDRHELDFNGDGFACGFGDR
ncbi:hypothetical protein [Umezawaea sp. Da 62-37]|uniref:hypothetical protein n=1 Tax=Umezawaea sp. Da 62-37 TaxID=3075927 RepID=UPI0028F72D01|nr:hypothetical protein [Umezawaea sp. Da 62-37]WNV91125.1 hypothetical protein RM788_23450 [Umezawaea sp. Da 62-37]